MTELFCVIGQLGNGGTERQLYLFLESLDRFRYKVTVIVAGKEGGIWEERIRKLEIPLVFLGSHHPLIKLWKFRRLAQNHRPAVIFSWSFFTNAFYCVSGPKARFIGSLRQSLQYSKMELNFLRFRLSLHVPVMIVNSPSLVQELNDENYPKEKICLVNNIYLPIPLSERKRKTEVRERFGIPQDAIVILGVGRDSPSKDFPFFVDVLKQVMAVDSRVHGWILGTGGNAQRERIQQEGLESRFTLSGEIPDARNSMHAADVFFLSSRSEGFANVLLEAGDAGCAIVATNVNGVLDFFGDVGPDSCCLIQHGDVKEGVEKILELVRDPEKRRCCVEKAQSQLFRFCREESMNKYMKVIESRSQS